MSETKMMVGNVFKKREVDGVTILNITELVLILIIIILLRSMIAEIIASIVLLSLYLIYHFNLIDRFLANVSAKRELQDIEHLFHTFEGYFKQKDSEKCEQVYSQITDNYRNLSKNAKDMIFKRTQDIYNQILMLQTDNIISDTIEHINKSEREAAKQKMKEIREMYAKLNKQNKAAIVDRYELVLEKISTS
ncbi:hypothetical protein H6503_02795 [Candidatus Woesearchaeota archaeon]|nr:hypothetical protein [Candidatus Woesearchaeota archaeon]